MCFKICSTAAFLRKNQSKNVYTRIFKLIALLDPNNPEVQNVDPNALPANIENVNNIVNVQQDGIPINQPISIDSSSNTPSSVYSPVKPIDETNFDFVLVTPTNTTPRLEEITNNSVQSPVVVNSEIKQIDSSPIKTVQNNLPQPPITIESKPEVTPIKSPETTSPTESQPIQNLHPNLSPIKPQQPQQHQQPQHHQPVQQQPVEQPVKQSPIREQYVKPEPVQPPQPENNNAKNNDLVEPVPLPFIIQPPKQEQQQSFPQPPQLEQEQEQQQQQQEQTQPKNHRNDFAIRRDSLDVNVKDELINNYVQQKSITGINTKVLKTVTISENENNNNNNISTLPPMMEDDEEYTYEDRARSSLSKGYNVIKHCGGLSRPHETFVILADDELTWRRKGGKDFASIPLKEIEKITMEDKTVIIKGKSRDLEIDIPDTDDRKEFCDSLNELIKHKSYVPPTPPLEHREIDNSNNNSSSLLPKSVSDTPIQFRNSSLSAPITPIINNDNISFNSSSTTPTIMLSPEITNRKEMIDNFVQQKHDNNQECKVVLQSVTVAEATVPPSIMEETQENRAERARSSLSRGYNVMKHCGGFSKPHETFIILSGDELTWRRKGNKDFASIPLKDITLVKTEGKKVTIKSKSRNLEIDIENEDDRTEFAESLNELIKH